MNGAYLLVLLLIVIWYTSVLLQFSFQYTDSDQTLMWMALRDYSQGVFHEPRFYGQAYNSMIEALLAVPLYWAGVSPSIALPIVSSLLSLVPYIFISSLMAKFHSKVAGLVVLCIPLLLPTEYSLISVLPRGFVTGIAAASFCCLPVFYPHKKTAYFVLGLAMVFAYSLNPNSVVFSLPCLAYIALKTKYSSPLLASFLLGILLGAIPHYLAWQFYESNPHYIVHPLVLHFSFQSLFESFNNLDKYFNDLTPLFWKHGYVLPIGFVLLGLLAAYQKKWAFSIFFLSTISLVIITLGFDKVHDARDSVFYSFSRMYLALPASLALGVSFVSINKQKWLLPIMLLVFLAQGIKYWRLESTVNSNLSKPDHKVVVVHNEVLKDRCTQLQLLCEKHHVDLVVVKHHPLYDPITYGCPILELDFPKTLRPPFERRTWRLKEDEKIIYPTILFISEGYNLCEQDSNIKMIDKDEFIYLLQNNQEKTLDLVNRLEIGTRAYH